MRGSYASTWRDGKVSGNAAHFLDTLFGGILAFEPFDNEAASTPVSTGVIVLHLARLCQKRDVLLRVLAENYSPEYLLVVSWYVGNADFVCSVLPPTRKDTPRSLGYQFDDEERLDMRHIRMTWCTATRWRKKEFNLVGVDGDQWFWRRNRKLLLETLVAMVR